MSSVSLDRFHVRPSRYVDESWPAYLTRFASENGIDGIPALAKILKVKSVVLLCSSPAGNDAQPAIVLPQIGARERIGSPTAWGRAWNARVCPHCFAEGPAYGRISWEHPLQLRCAKHHCMLVDRCPDCWEPIKHSRKRIDKCDCDRDLSSISTTTVPAWVMSMEMAFQEAFVEVPTLENTVSEIAKSAARVLHVFARCKADPAAYDKRGVCDWTAMILSSSFDLLRECFQDSWTGMPHEFMWQIKSDPSKKLHYSYQRRKISAFKHVNDLVTSLRENCERQGVIRGPLSGIMRSQNRWLTQLSPVTGLSVYELRTMVEKGQLPEVRREQCPKTGRVKSLIDAVRFAEIERECEGLPTIAIAANRLCISASTVKNLVEKRLLGDSTSRPAYLSKRLGIDDLHDLTCFLGSHVYLDQSLPPTQRAYLGATLDDIVVSHPEIGANQLFGALSGRHLPLYTATAHPSSLGDYYFDRHELSGWRKEALALQ